MGFRDSACVVYRLSQRPYRPLFEQVWGAGALNFRWPADAARTCDTVWDGEGKHCDQDPNASPCLQLTVEDRAAVGRAYDEFATSVAVNEASDETSPFTSKFDYFLAGLVKLTPAEQAGLALFNGKARCHECHTSSGPEPLFTDFAAENLGIPPNPEDSPGPHKPDLGVGAFLANRDQNPNFAEWSRYAPRYMGKFQTATLRNVDMRPYPEFVKAYTHNGYFKSLKEVVHFYNTRDTLPRCKAGASGAKVTCWPAPDVAENVNKTQMGNLGLTGAEEDEIAAFLKTLTDGYRRP
jgi:cytochrome c peroxidase